MSIARSALSYLGLSHTPPARRLSLALQGGGSFGAFTWGVLDTLLDDGGLEFDIVSGASAGAVNAVLLASGLVESRERAREKLESFWRRVSATGAIFRRAADVSGFELLSSALSPYQFNPFNLDPLREALEETVDFDALRRASPVRLMIAATRVSDGHPRIFDEREISVDVVLASAALPLLRQAVTVDGEPFWDGGFAANPPLLALAHETRARDILVVQLTPAHVEELPRSRKDIKRRLEQISLNSTLNVELEALRLGARVGATRRLRDLRVHRVAAEDSFDALAERSAVDLDWSFLSGLRDAGRRAAEKWRHEDMHFAKV